MFGRSELALNMCSAGAEVFGTVRVTNAVWLSQRWIEPYPRALTALLLDCTDSAVEAGDRGLHFERTDEATRKALDLPPKKKWHTPGSMAATSTI
ncbi:hypothetical protein HETIRDRAFT_162497 [Heterobasidion irregulare TC 32-1]|uniref:Uncharacterized protein n=1 Tax=Heterobasidion irregulare (strain TC 32-1) TaxID=747525 RepID=W4JQ94_HETIT|nr:uncharacterized protein HETIRDRAFT_162497 [Heterobasidion irregulare TC 32-1]ETW75732.1 hypothetical protein HETIRDRAFT_162497 [Heterobasidion irregulare TC 32-1]